MGWQEQQRKKWMPGYWLRHPMSSLAFCMLVGVLCLTWAAVSAYETKRLDQHGISVAGTLLQVHPGSGGSSYVVAQFVTADGQTVVAELDDYVWDPEPHEGDPTTVIYDPEAPALLVIDSRYQGDYGTMWFGIGLALIFGVGGGWFLRRTWRMWRDNAEAWCSGEHVA